MNEQASRTGVGSKLLRATSIVTVALIIGYIISFGKTAIVAAYLGTGWQMDTFLWSYALIILLSTVVLAPLTSALVPVYLSLKAKDLRLAQDLFNAVLGLSFVVFVLVSAILVVGAPLVAQWLGGSLGSEGVALATQLVWLMAPVVLFSGVWCACQAVLNAEKSFFLATLSPYFPTVVVIVLVIAVKPAQTASAQAVGYAIGAVIQWLILMIVLWRQGLGRRWSVNIRTEGMSQLLKLLWPLVVTQALILGLPFLDRTMAAKYSTGTISALGYAQMLMGTTATLLLTAVSTAILPFLSQQVAEDGIGGFRRTFFPTVRVLITLTIPMTVILLVLREPVVRLVFERGAFNSTATQLTAPAFAAYLVGVVPMAITFVCSRGFNALKDSKTNAVIGVFFLVVVRIVMNVVLAQFWGYLGIAWSSSVAYVATATAMLWVMRRRTGSLGGRPLIQTLSKTLGASCIGAICAWWGMLHGGGSAFGQLLAGGTLAVLGYAAAAYCLRIDDIRRLTTLSMHTIAIRGRILAQGVARQ